MKNNLNTTIVFLFLLSGILFGGIKADAQITWSKDIAPIIYNHCTSCHRPGEIGPFSLTNYQQTASWASTIQYVTEIRFMPPWKADTKYGPGYFGENYLTDDQIKLIKTWVESGMPQGDPAEEPPLPVFPTGSQIGKPDLVVSFAQTHVHPGTGYDEYRYFVLPTKLTEDKDLIGLEMRPGNTKVVHHALVWEDTTGAAAAMDAQTPEYGYLGTQTGGNGAPGGQTQFSNQLPGYVPGQRARLLTNGMAQSLHAGSDLVVQVHYAPTASDEADSSSFNLFFADKPASRYLKSKIMLPFLGTLTNGPFFIPGNTTKEFHGTWKVPEEVSMLGIAPHMHLLGTHWMVFAVTPTNDTIQLIRIPEWDFNWQGTYYFKKLIRIPAKSVIHAYAGYDNTLNNVNNPSNPPKLVSWGEGTADEMYYLPLLYLSYQPGDENLILDEFTTGTNSAFTFRQSKLYPVWPNPASQTVKIGYTLEKQGRLNLHIIDAQGRLVAALAENRLTMPGEHIQTWDPAGQPGGLYLVRMQLDNKVWTQKLLVGQ